MLLIRNRTDHQAGWTSEQHQLFLKRCEVYINSLKKDKKLIAAQPLVRDGITISGNKSHWTEQPFNEDEEVQVGYYHILAVDMKDAVAIAKKNPEFEFSHSARIEVRPVKTKENITGFVYPKKEK